MVTLESSRLFAQLSEEDVALFRPQVQEIDFQPNQIVFREGDKGDGIYVVKEGLIQITSLLGSTEQRVFVKMAPGEFFGEMSVVDQTPRSATATAERASTLYFLPRVEVLRVLDQSPRFGAFLVKEISHRLRAFNRQYIREVLQAERLTLVGRFARSIVHDLKNPLNIIGIAAELACTDSATPESRQLTKERIHKQVDRISTLINELLDFTQPSSPLTVLATADYAAFVGKLIDEMRAEIGLKNCTLGLRNPPPSVRVGLNPKRLNRVFYNLIHNAIDAMGDGGTIRIGFDVNPDEKQVITTIEDTGSGIPPEVLDHLFEAFVTFGKANGTGMGLSICKKIIEDHHGRIFAYNKDDQSGAVFAFSLPVQG